MINPRIAADTPVIIHGISSPQGRRHARLMRDYGTNIVGGISPDAATDQADSLPVFQSCAEAVAATRAEACVTLVRPEFTAGAIVEAAETGLRMIVSVTEGVPVHDTMRTRRRIHDLGTTWIGPSSAGLAIPAARVKLGCIPDSALMPGPVGLITKSGSLAYEVGRRMIAHGIGQSVWVGVGGDLVKGTRFADLLPFFAQDDETSALVVIGEIGGTEEQDLAQALLAQGFAKPVLAIVAGQTAPKGVTMGHSGAIIRSADDTVAHKTAALVGAGATVYNSIGSLIAALEDAV